MTSQVMAAMTDEPSEARWGEPEGGACDPPAVVGDSTKS
jgi:hypothetical protein